VRKKSTIKGKEAKLSYSTAGFDTLKVDLSLASANKPKSQVRVSWDVMSPTGKFRRFER